MTDRRPLALVFAPSPPPEGGVPGGIGAIVAVLMQEFRDDPRVSFAMPVRKEDRRRALQRSISSLARLARATHTIGVGGTVLFFSSAGSSFWEKCCWSLVVRLMGRRAAVVMVDGGFPAFFDGLSSVSRSVARLFVGGPHLAIGAQSPLWQQYYRSRFGRASVEVVSASVDHVFFDAKTPIRRENEKPFVRALYVGWITRDKGVLDLLDAIALLPNRVQDRIRLHLVGPVLDNLPRWQREIDRRRLGDTAVLVGTINDRSALLREYLEADLFVFPSHFEGFPQAVLEAAAIGLPTIATRVGGVPDILANESVGILVSPQAPSELAAALERLVKDADLRRRLGAELCARARETYTAAACAASYRSLLRVDRAGRRGSQKPGRDHHLP